MRKNARRVVGRADAQPDWQDPRLSDCADRLRLLAAFRDMLQAMAAAGTVGISDLQLITDDIDETMAHIRRHAIDAFGLRRRPPKPSTLLGEDPALTGASITGGRP
jgi:hypothetical protein